MNEALRPRDYNGHCPDWPGTDFWPFDEPEADVDIIIISDVSPGQSVNETLMRVPYAQVPSGGHGGVAPAGAQSPG